MRGEVRTNEQEPTLTEEEQAAGWRIVRLGTGPWRKIPPGTKLAADYLREHRARVEDIRAKVMTLKRSKL